MVAPGSGGETARRAAHWKEREGFTTDSGRVACEKVLCFVAEFLEVAKERGSNFTLPGVRAFTSFGGGKGSRKGGLP